MPERRFNRTDWPPSGPHRDLLELFDCLHAENGQRSLRELGTTMHLAYTRVHEIVRGSSLPVSDAQVRSLVHALRGPGSPETDAAVALAVDLYRQTLRARHLPAGPVGSTEDPIENRAPSWVRRVSRRHVVTAAIGALVLGATVALAAITTGSAPRSSPTVGAQQTILADGFDGTALRADLWNQPVRPDLVYVRDGVLDLVANTAGGAEVRTELVPRFSGEFTQISMVVSIPEVARAGGGGPALFLTETSGRTHRVVFAPGPGGLRIEALICSRARCNRYDDFDPPAQPVPFDIGERVPIRVVDSKRLRVYVRDHLVAEGPADGSKLAAFLFDVYGYDEDWRATVDDLTVTR